VLCCVDEDATFAAHVLREAALRHCGYWITYANSYPIITWISVM
jgi:hypothetical protein